MRLIPAIAAATLWATAAQAQPPNVAVDYGKDETWLCKPGRADACDIDMTATIVNADGSYTREPWTRDPKAPIDCFYVYPSVSLDRGPNSDMIPGEEERSAVRRQIARFGKVCRVFSPVYRQGTLTAINAAATPSAVVRDDNLAYRDVLNAWRHYIAHDNQGRGVVIFGHSQGSRMLRRLLMEEIDGKPVEKQLVSAVILGYAITVPKGKDVGGDLKATPLCRSADQTGCVISYASFRSTVPPPANTRFGHTEQPGMEVACVNPANLAGAGAAPLKPIFVTASMHAQSLPQKPWVNPPRPVTTPYVRVPGLISGRCVNDGRVSYLEMIVNGDPKDPRTDDIVGDHVDAQGRIQADIGLHSLDVPLGAGSLIEVVERQGAAWRRKNGR